MSKKKLIIIISAGTALVVLLVLGIVFLAKGKKNTGGTGTAITSQSDNRRQNIFKLVKGYLEQGEYDRALNLIDGLLIENSEDEEARELQRQILQMDRQKDSGALTEMQRQLREDQRRQNENFAVNFQRASNDLAAFIRPLVIRICPPEEAKAFISSLSSIATW